MPMSQLYHLVSDPDLVYVVTTPAGQRLLTDRMVVTGLYLVREVFSGMPDGQYRLYAGKPPVLLEEFRSTVTVTSLARTAETIAARDGWIPVRVTEPVFFHSSCRGEEPRMIVVSDHGLHLVLTSVWHAWHAFIERPEGARCQAYVSGDGKMVRFDRQCSYGLCQQGLGYVCAQGTNIDLAGSLAELAAKGRTVAL